MLHEKVEFPKLDTNSEMYEYKLVSKVCEIEVNSKQCASGAQKYTTWELLDINSMLYIHKVLQALIQNMD